MVTETVLARAGNRADKAGNIVKEAELMIEVRQSRELKTGTYYVYVRQEDTSYSFILSDTSQFGENIPQGHIIEEYARFIDMSDSMFRTQFREAADALR